MLERSADLKVFGRFLAAIAHNFILDDLTLIKRAQACPLDGRNVNEHILAAALRLNESVAFGWVEPLHGSSSHHRLLASVLAKLRAPAMWRLQRHGNDLRAARIGKLSKADHKSSCRLLVRSALKRVNVIRGLAPPNVDARSRVSWAFWSG